MGDILKKPYEISLWDDDLVFRVSFFDKDGKEVAVKEYFNSLDKFEPIEGTSTKVV
mgnify:CR=1 FL=1